MKEVLLHLPSCGGCHTSDGRKLKAIKRKQLPGRMRETTAMVRNEGINYEGLN